MRRRSMSTRRFLPSRLQLRVRGFKDRSGRIEFDHRQIDLERQRSTATAAIAEGTAAIFQPRVSGLPRPAWACQKTHAGDHSRLQWPMIHLRELDCLLTLTTTPLVVQASSSSPTTTNPQLDTAHPLQHPSLPVLSVPASRPVWPRQVQHSRDPLSTTAHATADAFLYQRRQARSRILVVTLTRSQCTSTRFHLALQELSRKIAVYLQVRRAQCSLTLGVIRKQSSNTEEGRGIQALILTFRSGQLRVGSHIIRHQTIIDQRSPTNLLRAK